jgi:hypothetical protein
MISSSLSLCFPRTLYIYLLLRSRTPRYPCSCFGHDSHRGQRTIMARTKLDCLVFFMICLSFYCIAVCGITGLLLSVHVLALLFFYDLTLTSPPFRPLTPPLQYTTCNDHIPIHFICAYYSLALIYDSRILYYIFPPISDFVLPCKPCLFSYPLPSGL